jgi:tetratricopeptide (TPR) repeat protein
MKYMKYMKTSNLNRILFLTACLICLTSCDDLLEESPKAMVVETFFNNPDEVETALNAAYSPLRAGSGMSTYEATLDCSADYSYGRGSWAQISEYAALNDANISRVAGLWTQFYLSIRNANLVVKNTPAGSNMERYIAEARFLRAFNYFQLVRCWGGVPLRTEENMSDVDLKRSSVSEVYDLIVSDLLRAEEKLPDSYTQIGRPTVWAAKTLLADVYLQLGRYAEARDKAGEVIRSDKFSLVPVSSVRDFQEKVFGPTLISTTEEIFYLKYARQSGQQNYMLWILNHEKTGAYNFGGAYAIHGDAANPVYRNWDDGDFRKGLWQQVDFGVRPTTLVSTKFCDTEAIDRNGGGNDDPVYGYSDLLLIYAEAANMAANGPTAEALEAVNQIRRRAYGKAPKTVSEIDFKLADYNVNSFLDLVIKERSYEFTMEGKRWLELKRTGKAKEIIQAVKSITVADAHLLWPIPVSEINYNKALDPVNDQNPGYN